MVELRWLIISAHFKHLMYVGQKLRAETQVQISLCITFLKTGSRLLERSGYTRSRYFWRLLDVYSWTIGQMLYPVSSMYTFQSSTSYTTTWTHLCLKSQPFYQTRNSLRNPKSMYCVYKSLPLNPVSQPVENYPYLHTWCPYQSLLYCPLTYKGAGILEDTVTIFYNIPPFAWKGFWNATENINFKIKILCNVTPCWLLSNYWHFKGS